jgi:SAM-dependent methyltransferase
MGKGWFVTVGRHGDRTLAQQMLGLDELFESCKGKTVLDVGCAEGLISTALARTGATAVHGVEIVEDHVKVGTKLRGDLPVTLEVGDLNTWRPKRTYDIVIALALLHKLKNPTEVCAALAACCLELMVLRLPPVHAPTIVDDRSGGNPHHIGVTMVKAGFEPVSSAYDGPFGEWVGVYRRVRA